MALLYSTPVHYPSRRQQLHQPPPQPVVPVVIHGTTYYSAPSVAPDPALYVSVPQSSRPAPSSFAYTYSTPAISHVKSQNQGVYSPGTRNRRAWPKQNGRPPRMFNRGPLNNTTNVAPEGPYVSVPLPPQANNAVPKTPSFNATYKSNNNPRNAAVNHVPVQPRQQPNNNNNNNPVTRFDHEGDAAMTNASAPTNSPIFVEKAAALKAVLQNVAKESAVAPEPLVSTFLRNFLGRPLPFNIHDTMEAEYVAHLIKVLSEPHSPAAKLLIDWSPAFVLRLQQFMLVRTQGAAVEEVAKQAKERCNSYMLACKDGANPAGGRAWLASREIKKPQPRLHKHVLLAEHKKKLGRVGTQDFVDLLI